MNKKARMAAAVTEKSTKPILVIGTSHTAAVGSALPPALAERIEVVRASDFFGADGKKQKSLPDNLPEFFAPTRIFCSFGGSEHNIFGLMEAPVPFDFHYPGLPMLEPERWIIPQTLVRATLLIRMQRFLDMATDMKRMFQVPVVHLCSPPPFRIADAKVTLPDVFRARGISNIAPMMLRRKLHALHSDIVRGHCEKMGIGFLPCPPASMDADGHLLREYWTADPTHGNAGYGSLVLQQILETVDG